MASSGGMVLNETARAVLERELEQVMKDIRHYELHSAQMWRDWDRANTALRESWKRQGQLLEALRGA